MVIPSARATNRSAATLAGAALLLAISGCGTPSPSATTSSGASGTPSASSTPDLNTAPAWTATGSMIEVRAGPATLLLDGRVLVAGGGSPSSDSLASAELYDPTNGTWTAMAGMVEARVYHTATLLPDGRVLVAGGVGTATSEFFANILASAELYDPSTGRWTPTGAMLGIRAGHTATLLPDGTVLVTGGFSSSDGDGGPLASAELYDPSTGQWTVTGSTIGAGTGRTATLLGDGKVLVVGGSDSNLELVAFAELYDSSSGTWSATGEMVEARSGHTATLLPDGRVLVAGNGTDLASAELYDPSTGQWTATGAMLEGRLGHTATLLSNGTVLVAGSMAGTGALASAELYDPATGEWTATAAMSEGRLGHTATLLFDGRVLVVGGTNSVIDGGVPVASAELYDPGSGT